MNLDIIDFIKTNKTIFIWLCVAAILYFFRDMFGLIFITFILCFVTNKILKLVTRRIPLGHRVSVIVMYILYLAGIFLFMFHIVPTLLEEVAGFTAALPRALRSVEQWINEHSWVPQAVSQIRDRLNGEQVISQGWAVLQGVVQGSIQYASWFFLSLLFSFFIMLDLPRITKKVKGIKNSRLGEVYEETAGDISGFVKVVGDNFSAQIITSLLDTILMAGALKLIGLNNIVMLSTLFFFCGLIPVLWVILSAIPIVFVAVKTGGLELGHWSLAAGVAVSVSESYLISPRVVSSIMHLNPAITIMILYIAYNLMGIWGMFFGVPIAVFFYRKMCLGEEVCEYERHGSIELLSK